MSGRRPWAGYGLALSLALLVMSGGCGQRSAAKAVTPEPAPAAEEAEAAGEAAAGEAAEASEDSLYVKGIKLVEDEGQSGVFVKLSRVPDRVEHFTLRDPNRLVIDVYGPVSPSAQAIERAAVDDPKVSRVRVGRQTDRLRVSVDLKGEVPPYTLNDLQTMVVAFLGERSGQPAPPRSQVLYAAAEPEAPAPRASEVAPTEAYPVRTATRQQAAPTPSRTDPARVYTGEKISLDFKDADVLNVLRILAEVSGLNIVATDDVKGRVTVRLVDVPWDQALDIVLQSNRLDTVQIGNVLRVSTTTRLKEEREAQLAAEEAAKELEPLRVSYISVNYMKVDDKQDPLIPKIEDVLSDRGTVKTDARTNTVIVRDIQAGIDDARELIQRLDKQTPQVLIESNVVEATDTFTRDLGIQWGYSYAVGPQFGTATGREFPSSFVLGGDTRSSGTGDPVTFSGDVPGTGPAAQVGPGQNAGPTLGVAGAPAVPIPFIADFPARSLTQGEGAIFDIALGSIDGSKALNAKLSALERDGKAKIISRPKVVTLNNLPAKIEAIRIFRVRLPSTGTVISTGAGGVAGSAQAATEQIRAGITLDVKPQVSADGFILLEINVKSSTADFTQQVDNIPAEVSREARTNVLIKDGETVVLGGVFRNTEDDQESGIPYLRRIPGLGWLFKRMFRNRQREELLVFITPRIVKSG
ncbi:MAG: type IV pilus secretin PilQ, partial [Candidatus Binatia bacterium]